MIVKENFGYLPDGRTAELYTITNSTGMSVRVSTYGAALVSVLVPDKNGAARDVILGYDTVGEYGENDGYLGATVGRFANRIKDGRFVLGGREYRLPQNDGQHCLHGGGGFHQKLWEARAQGNAVTMTYVSPHGEDGFPGTLTAEICFRLDEDNTLHLEYTASSDADTVCSLTNHAYFNLHGGSKPVFSHELYLNAEKYTAVDETLIPVEDRDVEGTEFDFRCSRSVFAPVYDHNFVLNQGNDTMPQATLYEEETGIFMELFTDRPGVQVYASGMLTERRGKNGQRYAPGFGLCLETQLPPDAPNRPECTGHILPGGETMKTHTALRFGVR